MTNQTCPTKRRTKADIAKLRDDLLAIIEPMRPMTIRQIFFQAVGAGLIDKTEREYKNSICRLLANMRRDGQMPYGWIADNTRWQRKPRTYASLAAMLEQTRRTYRRAIWDNQNTYVEVWLEKDALAGVLFDATAQWDVPLMVCKGYPSLSFVHEAAMTISQQQRPVYLYYFGDHDPSGADISRFVEETIGRLAPDAELHFKRVAVNARQIEAYDLPTRPTKKTDSRARNLQGESVEVDALPPATLRLMCERSIQQHIDEKSTCCTRKSRSRRAGNAGQRSARLPGGAAMKRRSFLLRLSVPDSAGTLVCNERRRPASGADRRRCPRTRKRIENVAG